MAKVIINDVNFDFMKLFADPQAYEDDEEGELEKEITEILFGTNDEGIEYIQFHVHFSNDADSYIRYVLSAGGFNKYISTNGGNNWVHIFEYGNASRYGTVKLSDSYLDTGAAVRGLVPSQKALSDAVVPKDITSQVSKTNTNIFTVEEYSVSRAGRLIEVTAAVFSGSATQSGSAFLTGLPKPFKAVKYAFNNTFGQPITITLGSTGNLLFGSSASTNRTYIHFTYLAAE